MRTNLPVTNTEYPIHDHTLIVDLYPVPTFRRSMIILRKAGIPFPDHAPAETAEG